MLWRNLKNQIFFPSKHGDFLNSNEVRRYDWLKKVDCKYIFFCALMVQEKFPSGCDSLAYARAPSLKAVESGVDGATHYMLALKTVNYVVSVLRYQR